MNTLAIIVCAGFTVASACAAHADDAPVKLSADELQIINRVCDAGTRHGAERTICLRNQTDKLTQERQINAENHQMEDLTNQELGTRQSK